MSRHKNHLEGDVEFVLVILVGGTAYAHRELISKAIHYVVPLAVGLATYLFVYLLVKYIRRLTRQRHNKDFIIEDTDRMTGLEFEHFVADLLSKQGYTNVRLTERYDYGIDIIAKKDGITWGVQVKRYSGLVKANAVRQAVAALKIYGCDRAMVITNSRFSKVAIKLAESNQCKLIERTNMTNLTS